MPADAERHGLVLDLAIESLRQSGALRFRAQGLSMLPTIQPGTWVAVRQTTPDDVRKGDIVLAQTATGLRLHRVVEVRYNSAGLNPHFITRGDNHSHCDWPVYPAQLLGKLCGTGL